MHSCYLYSIAFRYFTHNFLSYYILSEQKKSKLNFFNLFEIHLLLDAAIAFSTFLPKFHSLSYPLPSDQFLK